MRVHGESKLSRRKDIKTEKDYKNYLKFLREDFNSTCGYCGKNKVITTTGFEIDHFVPQSIDPNKTNIYENLIYCCFTCNRKKGNKWPTEDKDLHHDGKIGFVDPISEEYDVHLSRNQDGTIIPQTDIGKYMCENAFKFNLRPMAEMWKMMELINEKTKLRELILGSQDKISKEYLLFYVEFDKKIDELRNIVFDNRE